MVSMDNWIHSPTRKLKFYEIDVRELEDESPNAFEDEKE